MSLSAFELTTIRHSALEAAERFANARQGAFVTQDILEEVSQIASFLVSGDAPSAATKGSSDGTRVVFPGALKIDGEPYDVFGDVSFTIGNIAASVPRESLAGVGGPCAEAYNRVSAVLLNPIFPGEVSGRDTSPDVAGDHRKAPAKPATGLTSPAGIAALGEAVEVHINSDAVGGNDLMMDIPPGYAGVLLRHRPAA